MADPVALAEAKLFLRVDYTDEDSLITTLLAASKTRIEGLTGLTLSDASPAPLRLSVLLLLAEAYQNRGQNKEDQAQGDDHLMTWLAPYLSVRL
jgi:uncharacterized phage protein (predicted DNA packaging)